MPAPGGSPFRWLSSGKESLQKNIFTHQPSPKLRTVPDGFGFAKLAHAVKNFSRRYSKELNFLEARERKSPFVFLYSTTQRVLPNCRTYSWIRTKQPVVL